MDREFPGQPAAAENAVVEQEEGGGGGGGGGCVLGDTGTKAVAATARESENAARETAW